jgi:methylmalonyl-CoA/ethylmalonyl-CoA epimerase
VIDMTDLAEPVTVAGNCHRVAFAVDDLPAATAWFRAVLGASLMPVEQQSGDAVALEGDGALLAILWLQNVPIVLLAASDPVGTVGRYLAANGPSVQSLAWEIPDMWRTENLLRAGGYRIVGTDIPGRHFFVHPRDTLGLLLEYTDDELAGDPRRGAAIPVTEALVPVASVARVTAIVDDLDAAAECLRYTFSGELLGRLRLATDDDAIDVRIGDITVRLVVPASPVSRYARRGGNNAYHSLTLAVDDFAGIDARLAAAGIGVDEREPGSVWTVPADTLGIRLQFVDAATITP